MILEESVQPVVCQTENGPTVGTWWVLMTDQLACVAPTIQSTEIQIRVTQYKDISDLLLSH